MPIRSFYGRDRPTTFSPKQQQRYLLARPLRQMAYARVVCYHPPLPRAPALLHGDCSKHCLPGATYNHDFEGQNTQANPSLPTNTLLGVL